MPANPSADKADNKLYINPVAGSTIRYGRIGYHILNRPHSHNGYIGERGLIPAAAILREQDEDGRIFLARLQLILDSLPAAFYFNAAGVAIFGIGMHYAGAIAGHIGWGQIAAATLVQLIAGGAAWLIHNRRQQAAEQPRKMETRLLLLQVLLAAGWGTVGWVYWAPDSDANIVAIGMGIFMNTWSTVFLRSSHRGMLFLGIIIPTGMIAARNALTGGTVCHLFLIGEALWIVYILSVGMAARRHIGQFLTLRYAHEDQATALAQARDIALTREREACAANTAKSAFLANMSHELRTPLNAILGFSELIMRYAKKGAPGNLRHTESYAKDIHESGTMLLEQINGLLDIAKIEAGRIEIDRQPIDLTESLNAIDSIIRVRSDAKAQRLTITVAPDTPMISADGRAIRQILLNLLSNAVKFTPLGGEINISISACPPDGVKIEVADTGPGIPPDKLDCLFHPFAQADNRYSRSDNGTGLGLALVRGLIELHGGKVWAENGPEGGARLHIYLPRH